MAFDQSALEDARLLIEKAGMVGFQPDSATPVYAAGHPVEIALIDPPRRAEGVPNFDKPDPERPGVVRSSSILAAIREGTPLPPLLLFQRAGDVRYELRDGFHRLHLCAVLGFTHVPAEVTDWKPGED